jgi:hypothetical protein
MAVKTSQSASGVAPTRKRLNTLAQIHENAEAIRCAKQGASTTQATRTPQGPQPYQLWTPEAVCSLKISYGKDEKPNLDSQDTLLYDCFCELNVTSDKALDPPAYVHLSDREVGRLYLLVHTGNRTLEYLSVTWPHVFDPQGALWVQISCPITTTRTKATCTLSTLALRSIADSPRKERMLGLPTARLRVSKVTCL